jgi:hypothetical protein
MAYTLNTSQTDFRGGKNILASEHMQWLEAGATLDAEAFGEGYIEVGTAIARNTQTGKFEPYADGEEGGAPEGFDEFALLNIDLNCDGENDIIVGEVLIRASVYDAKLPDNVTEQFKELTRPLIRYVREI